MKLYFYSNITNINSYFIVDEESTTKEGIVIDPTHINEHLIEKIENERVLLKLVLLTNASHPHIFCGINSLEKVYKVQSYSVNSIGKTKEIQTPIYESENLQIEAYPIKMNGQNVCMYKIGLVLFTGLTFSDIFISSSTPSFLEKIERERIKELLFSLNEATLCFPLSGPPFTIKTFKFYANN